MAGFIETGSPHFAFVSLSTCKIFQFVRISITHPAERKRRSETETFARAVSDIQFATIGLFLEMDNYAQISIKPFDYGAKPVKDFEVLSLIHAKGSEDWRFVSLISLLQNFYK